MGRIERRILEAALLVAGCDHSIEPQHATQPFAEPPPPSPLSPPDAAVTPSPLPEGPEAAKALCATRKQARVDRTPPAKPPRSGRLIAEVATWDANAGVAACTIIHAKLPGIVTVMHSPQWCPQSRTPQPRPEPLDVPGQRFLVERAVIKPDGTVASSELEWMGYGVDPTPRHNCGRRFEGLVLEAAGDEPGAQLAAMAELEAASVPAFERLARELAAWHAPSDLVERARAAMADEVRHARVMTALARRYGRAPRAIDVPELPCRSLAEIAIENAIEGCVREAYGALIATYQAERASPALRPAFRAIAADERGHADLAEAVHTWLVDQLDDRGSIEVARELAERELRASLPRTIPCPELGLPGAVDALALYDAYFA